MDHADGPDDRMEVDGDESGDTTDSGYDSEQHEEAASEDSFSEDDSGSDAYKHEDDAIAGVDDGPLFDLGEALAQSHQQSHELGFGGPADFLPTNPDLHVEGFGAVSLPLVDSAQADAFSQVCEQAPYGKGRDTLVDTKIRNSWQLSPDQFTIKHPDWQKGLEDALPMLAEKFGLSGVPLTLEPYKLLLYKPGGHFDKHQDTEKADGMFATLIVQLPSAHTGGRLHIYRGDTDTTAVHDFGQGDDTASIKCHYAAHYADAEHSLERVESGYRLALVYSICRSANGPSADPASLSLAPLQQALSKTMSDERPGFHYVFSHSYTLKSTSRLGVAALKGEDRVRVANLRAANSANPPDQRYTFALARVQRVRGWDMEGGDWWSDEEYSSTVISLPDLDGNTLASRTRFVLSHLKALDDNGILNPDRKAYTDLWRGHRTKEHEGYMGNEGPYRTTVYHKYVLVAVPMARFVEYLVDLDGAYAAYRYLLAEDPTVGQLVDFIDRVVKSRDDRVKDWRISIEPTEQLRDFAMLRQALIKSISEQYFPAPLLDAYFRLFSTTGLLIGDDESGWVEMMVLAKNARVWPMIQDRVSQIFDPHFALIFFGQCLDAGLEIDHYPQVYAWLAEILHQPESAPVKGKDFTNRNMHQRVLQVILSGFDSKLSDHLVAQYMTLRSYALNTLFSVVLEYKSLIKDKDETIRQTLRPLLRKRAEWSKAYQHKVERSTAEGDWRFLEVKVEFNYGDKSIPSFLHGPERTYKYEYYGSKRAQRFCSRYAEEAEKAFITWQVFGRGDKAYIQITKTTGYFAWQQERCKGLAEELKVLEELIGDGAGDERAKEAVNGEVLAEEGVTVKRVEEGVNEEIPPEKRRKV